MKLPLIFIVLIVLPSVSASVIINEIMYNPEGNDDDREWLELYNNGNETINLTGWKFYEENTPHRLILTQGGGLAIQPNEYLVIVQDIETFLQDYPNYSGKVLDSSFSLSNEGELLIITNSGEETFASIVDIFYYFSQYGADSNGMSLCKINNIWEECIPTPGNENSRSIDYFVLKINEFMPDPIGNDDALIPDGEWVELYNPGEYSLDLDGLDLYDNIGSEADISISNSNTMNKTVIDPHDYLIVYMNGRNGFLNNDGFEKISLYKDNYLIDEVSYSNSVEGLSWSRVDDYWIQTTPTPNEENHFEEADYSSFLEIEKVYFGNDDKARFGDSLRIRAVIYRGDTSKYNVDLYVVDKNNDQVSKRSEINIEDKFKNITLIVPVQLEPNCNGKYNNGTYKVVLKGLDEINTEEIEIEGITKSLCEVIKISEKTSSEKVSSSQLQQSSEIQQETSSMPITSSVIYQSSDIKAKNAGIYFFCAVLLLLIIYLIFKKNL